MEKRWDISAKLGSGPPPDTIVCPIDRAEMVLVATGQFTMGITQEELSHVFMLDKRANQVFATEIPARSVYLEAHYIDRYPVTNYQYRKFLEETVHRKPYLWDHPISRKSMQPVVFVGWDDARAYAKWAGKSLPTEAQWKKQAGEQTGVSGHGAMSSSSVDVIPENWGLGPHQRSASSTQE